MKTSAPIGVNLGPYRITGQVILLADEDLSPPGPLGPVGPIMPPGMPESAPGAVRIGELIGRLASPAFPDREAAQAELTRLARRVPGVVEALVRALDDVRDPEARFRIRNILQELATGEAEQLAEQARILFGNLIAIRQRFPNGSDLEEEARADLEEAVRDIEEARGDVRRSGVDERGRRVGVVGVEPEDRGHGGNLSAPGGVFATPRGRV